jgi:hypothetical protein
MDRDPKQLVAHLARRNGWMAAALQRLQEVVTSSPHWATPSSSASGASQMSDCVVQSPSSECRAVIEPQAWRMAPTAQQIFRVCPITATSCPTSRLAGTTSPSLKTR